MKERLTRPFRSISERIRRVAAQDNVRLDFQDGVWVATDAQTGEKASDLSMAGAWAHLREIGISEVYERLQAHGVTVVRV